MSVVAFIFGVGSLVIVGNVPLMYCVPVIAVAAAMAAITELVTNNGYDTVTVPLVSALSIYGSYMLMGIE